MAYFLAKTDPDTYSFEKLLEEKETVWDGVTNPQAQQAIRAMKKGDRVLIYHSGGESAVVGWAKVTRGAEPDPGNPKLSLVWFGSPRRLAPPVTLAEIKATGRFNDTALVRQGRLSTMAVGEDLVAWLRERYPKSGL